MRFEGYTSFGRDGVRPRLRTHNGIEQLGLRAESEYPRLSNKQRQGYYQTTKGVTGRSVLFDLHDFDLVQRTLPDMMHIVSGVIGRHLFPSISKGKLQQQLSKEAARLHNTYVREVERVKEANLKLQAAYQRQMATWSNNLEKAKKASKRSAAYARKDDPKPQPPQPIPEPPPPAAAAQSERGEEIELQIDTWCITPRVTSGLEDHCWCNILAPPGIVGRTKKPFTTPSGLNSAQWMGVTKVTGKYLLSHLFTGDLLQALCDFLDFTTMCLASSLNAIDLERIKKKAQVVARDIDRFFPLSERSLVLHILIFHIPAYLEMWGPARCWWVFPYERSVHICVTQCTTLLHFVTYYIMLHFVTLLLVLTHLPCSSVHVFVPHPTSNIGHYVRSIKSRKYPEKNLMNRMLLESQVTLKSSLDIARTDTDSRDTDYVMVPSFSSSTTESNNVIWPTLNKDNCYTVYFYIETYKMLRLFIGPQVLYTFRNRAIVTGDDIICRQTNIKRPPKITIGNWQYATAAREVKPGGARLTTQSWFAIRAVDVPSWLHLVTECKDDYTIDSEAEHQRHPLLNGFLYGRFLSFVHLTIGKWQTAPFQLGVCNIFRGYQEPMFETAGIETINIKKAAINPLDHRGGINHYIDLTKVVCPIALGPTHTNWNEFTKGKGDQVPLISQPDCWAVMLCKK